MGSKGTFFDPKKGATHRWTPLSADVHDDRHGQEHHHHDDGDDNDQIHHSGILFVVCIALAIRRDCAWGGRWVKSHEVRR